MNKKQKIISGVCVILIFLAGLIPPWKVTMNDPMFYSERPIGYSLIFLPPELVLELTEEQIEEGTEEEIPHSVEVDTTRLIIQWVTLLFVLAAALFLTKENEVDFDQDYEE